jgi:hypothetical protein
VLSQQALGDERIPGDSSLRLLQGIGAEGDQPAAAVIEWASFIALEGQFPPMGRMAGATLWTLSGSRRMK